jgi:hypothetical protein
MLIAFMVFWVLLWVYFLQILFPVFNALHPAEHLLDVEHEASATSSTKATAILIITNEFFMVCMGLKIEFVRVICFMAC